MSTVTPLKQTLSWQSLADECAARWPQVKARTEPDAQGVYLETPEAVLRPLCAWLFNELDYCFSTMVVEEQAVNWLLTYVFYDPLACGWIYVKLDLPLAQTTLASIGDEVHAADWHEREVEDLFGLHFEGHPKLGDFVLHDDWPEGVNPMRKTFDGHQPQFVREQAPVWQPPTIVDAPGAFIMPVGPVYSDFAEAAHFVIETTGEDILRVLPRFFYKYRGVEKLAEGQTPEQVLLLAERFSGNSAFAHALAFCQALEILGGAQVPPRAQVLRCAFAELERVRHHAAAITALCASTGLAVAQAQGALIEENLLRLSAQVCGHRYLFGVLMPGGLAFDIDAATLRLLTEGVDQAAKGLDRLQYELKYSSSFLDRIEDVGPIRLDVVKDFGLVGPAARASGCRFDLRKLFRYAAYDQLDFEIPMESEGDGYARLRLWFREIAQSARIIRQTQSMLPDGPVAVACEPCAGAALGFAEAPLGAAFHWIRLDEQNQVCRYRLSTPAFCNWHAFRVAVEHFSFQDFPIILASFGLSQAECDR